MNAHHEEAGKFPDLNKVKDIPGFDEDHLFSITFTNVEKEGIKCKLISEEAYNSLMLEFEKLKQHYNNTINLWATDRTPDELVNKALYDGAERAIQTNTTSEDFLFDRIENDIKEELKKQMFQIK